MTCVNMQHRPSAHAETPECALVRKAAGWSANEITTDNTGPVWLLDVDGVINVDKVGRWHSTKYGVAWFGDEEFSILWAPKLIDHIKKIIDSDVVEIRWCSTWCAYAHNLEKLFGLPELGRSFVEEFSPVRARYEKRQAALNVIRSEGRRLIWVDDSEVPYTFESTHKEFVTAGAMLIRPQSTIGLQPVHMDRIERVLGI